MLRQATTGWFGTVAESSRRSRRTEVPHNPQLRRLHIEPLEDRRMLATITVDTRFDTVNATDGLTSLREAITQASSGDTIDFAASVVGGPPISLSFSRGALPITKSVTINGPGASLLTIRGVTSVVGSTSGIRVFNVDDGDDNSLIDVTIRGLTLTNYGVFGDGGAIRSKENLTLQQSIVTNTSTGMTATGNGGGIWQNLGSLTIVGGTINGNSATIGGGIWSSDAIVSIADTTISYNSASGFTLSRGGGIYTEYGSLSVSTSVLKSNTALGDGGGGLYINAADHFNISDSAITNNAVLGSGSKGGGLYAHAYLNPSSISGTTINGNQATNGGGVYIDSDYLTITNSTISTNRANDGAGVYNAGYVVVVIQNSTIALNQGLTLNPRGSGVFNSGYLALDHTIVGANTGAPGDAHAQSGIIAAYYSVIGSTSGSGFAFYTGNKIGVNPQLGPLADNGGFTLPDGSHILTHALLPGSPAMQAGKPSFASPPTYDQRGARYARVVGQAIDIGAFEVQPVSPPALPGDYTVNGSVDAADYVLWRKWRGAGVAPFSIADASGNGVVDQDDYTVWRTNFGETLPPPGAGQQRNSVSGARCTGGRIRCCGNLYEPVR